MSPIVVINFSGSLISGVVEYTWVGKVCNFRRNGKSLFSSETVRDRLVIKLL